MWPLRFTPAARAEITEAQEWHEVEAPAVGRRFRLELVHTVERLAATPLRFPQLYKSLRRARLRRFPDVLFFLIHGNNLLVVACIHSRRHPGRWQSRA